MPQKRKRIYKARFSIFTQTLSTGGLFNNYILDESICHFRDSGLFCRFYCILMENHANKNVDPDQTPHNKASDLGLHCSPMTLLWVSRSVRMGTTLS